MTFTFPSPTFKGDARNRFRSPRMPRWKREFHNHHDFQETSAMFCPNGHNQFVIGPEYVSGRNAALMTCLQCGARFDAYAQYGDARPKALRNAA